MLLAVCLFAGGVSRRLRRRLRPVTRIVVGSPWPDSLTGRGERAAEGMFAIVFLLVGVIVVLAIGSCTVALVAGS